MPVQAWFDAASADRPGAANGALEILRAMLDAARQWGEIGEHIPDPCANIAKNPRRPVARYLDRTELERLGAVLARHREQHPWPVAAVGLLTLTGARLSEVLNLKWDEIGDLGDDGTSARLEDSKTGPRTVWLGPEAVQLLAALPRTGGRERVFPEDLTSNRLYTFWVGIRDEAGLPGVRIHDCRHTWASQGVMNGVGLTTVGRLLGHRQRETTAIYAHLDDGALRDAADGIARAIGYSAEPPPFPEKAAAAGDSRELDWSHAADGRAVPPDTLELAAAASRSRPLDWTEQEDSAEETPRRPNLDWL